jgi:uncharacterized protein (DUF302 family)
MTGQLRGAIAILAPWAGGRVHGHQRTRTTGMSMAEAVRRLRETIALAGFSILADLDLAADIAAQDYSIRPARLLVIADPRAIGRLLAADPHAFVEAGWRIALFERPDRRLAIRWNDPLGPPGRFANDDMRRLGRELAMILTEIVDASLHIVASDIAP